MKLVKIFGIVMAFHGVAFMFIFAIPGCRSTSKKPSTAAAPVIGASETSPLSAAEPAATSEPLYTPSAEVSPVRFSPTRPGTPAASEVATAATPSSTTHTVVKGDNLWSIARKHGLSVKELAAANNLRSDTTLKLGQKLAVPGKAAAASSAPAAVSSPARAAATPAPAAPTTSINHVIKPGDTLGGIAKKYQVKVGDIATANNIGDPTKIRAGQSLKIPGWQAPASARAAASAPATSAPAAPATAPAPASEPLPTAPLAPSFESPVSPAPAPAAESPFIAPTTTGETAPMIRVEESGAPRIE